MKARIDNKVLEVKVLNNNYDEDRVEVEILEGSFKGFGAVINRECLIEERVATIKDVEFTKGSQWDAWEGTTYFWRADVNGITIATLCRTKKECMDEARRELKLNPITIEF